MDGRLESLRSGAAEALLCLGDVETACGATDCARERVLGLELCLLFAAALSTRTGSPAKDCLLESGRSADLVLIARLLGSGATPLSCLRQNEMLCKVAVRALTMFVQR